MLIFQNPPDVVFQAILRGSLDFTIDNIMMLSDDDGKLTQDEFAHAYPLIGKVFAPLLAHETLRRLRKYLDRPEIYDLNDYHYLLLFETLKVFAEIHNDGISDATNKEDRKERSFVNPFYIEHINFDDIVGRFFFDLDFLTPAEVMLEIDGQMKERLGFNSETFALSQGLLPHAEELELHLDDMGIREKYKISAKSAFFGSESKVYPDKNYYKKKHPEE